MAAVGEALVLSPAQVAEILNRTEAQVTVHQCPPEGSGIMPCCGRTPFEAMSDRMTLDPRRVTCPDHRVTVSATDDPTVAEIGAFRA